MIRKEYTEMERLRSYSSIFSRRVFSDIIAYNDYSRINLLLHRYNAQEHFLTYMDYIKYVYQIMVKKYRCEYIYKNEIINKLLLKRFGTKNMIAINEFRVNNSIADLVLFNGESKAFEIKTEYDSKKRLDHQIQDYSKLFQKSYIVIPEHLFDEYKNYISENTGIIILLANKKGIQLQIAREAIKNQNIDINILMRCLRTTEYKNIIATYFGKLPNVSCFEMFEKCQEWLAEIPQNKLHELFLAEIKKRKSNTPFLKSFPTEIRQMCLSMNLTQKQSEILIQKLNNTIIP